MKRPRLRKWAKWVCTLPAVLVLGLAVFSGFYRCCYITTANAGDTVYQVILDSGLFTADRIDGWTASAQLPLLGWHMGRSEKWVWGLTGEVHGPGNTRRWHSGVLWTRHSYGWEAGVSVLYIILVMTAPAALLWYADRRRPGPHACKKCNYDRRGLAAAVKCPECGTVPTVPAE